MSLGRAIARFQLYTLRDFNHVDLRRRDLWSYCWRKGAGRSDVRVHLDLTLERAPGSWELWFLGPPGTPTQTSVKRACPSHTGVRWMVNACSGPLGALSGAPSLGAESQEAWRTNLGTRLGYGGSGVRGRGRKTSPNRDGHPWEGRLGCLESRKLKGWEGAPARVSPTLSHPSLGGPLHRHGSPGRR